MKRIILQFFILLLMYMKEIINTLLNTITCLKTLNSIPLIPIINKNYYNKIKFIYESFDNDDYKKYKYNIWCNITILILFIYKLYCHKNENIRFFIKDSKYKSINGMNFKLGIYDFIIYSKYNYNEIIDCIDFVNDETKKIVKNIIKNINNDETYQKTLFNTYFVIYKFNHDFDNLHKFFSKNNNVLDICPSFIMKNEINHDFLKQLIHKQEKTDHYSNKIISYFNKSCIQFKIDPKTSLYKFIIECKLLDFQDSDKINIKFNSDDNYDTFDIITNKISKSSCSDSSKNKSSKSKTKSTSLFVKSYDHDSSNCDVIG